MTRRRAALFVLAGAVGWAIWSYRTGGIVGLLVAGSEQGAALDALRDYILGWGALAPLVYVGAVTIEVLVAPIPGALLYAPAGAIFGGLVGGTLSVIGNVLGAAIACWIGGTFGERWAQRHARDRGRLAQYREQLVTRGAWLVFLLRINPLTSSDLVSYAAGLAGMRPRSVAFGTLGLAPLCYAQAYFAEALFEWLPTGPLVVLTGIGVVILIVLVVFRSSSRGP